MKNIPRIGIVCLTMLVLIMAVSAVMHGAEKSSGKAELQEHWEGGMLPEDSPVTTRSYWRHWLTYAPPRVLKDGKLVPTHHRYSVNYGGSIVNQGRTEPPPAGWAGADFDDSAWPVSRVPMNMVHIPGVAQHMIRQTCLRTRFIVPDPGAVKKLVFTSVFYGGLVVYVNGKEVGRQHIPSDGMFAEAGFAEPLPELVYNPVGDEMMKLAKKMRLGSDRGWTHKLFPYNGNYNKKAEAQNIAVQVREAVDRRIAVEVPKGALRKGLNVLALELRLSPLIGRRSALPHGVIRWVTLEATPDGAVRSADERPEGVQVWTEDIHRRVMTEEFLEPGVKAGKTVRIVGARGGRYSAQVLVGTTGDLGSPSAKLSELVAPGGAKLPGSAARLRWGLPLDLAEARSSALALDKVKRERHAVSTLALLRYRKDAWAFREREERLSYPAPPNIYNLGGDISLGRWGKQKADVWKEYAKGLACFDQLSDGAPAKIPAHTCQPLWVTVEIPPGAKPGTYTGKLSLFAGGMDETQLPVRLQVFDWKMPAPEAYTIYSGIEQCPWSLARCAGVELWSEEHWKLIEESMKWCGRLGSRVAGIAVAQKSYIDNGKDTMIKWVKKTDGTYDYDFSLADRYLDVWRKHCKRLPDAIFHLTRMTGEKVLSSRPGTVVVNVPGTGKQTALTPIGKEAAPEGLKLWIDFIKALRTHYNARGIPDERILLGTFGDKVGDLNLALVDALHKEIPEIGWARSSHYGTTQKQKPKGEKKKYDPYGKYDAIGMIKWDAARRAGTNYGNTTPFEMKGRKPEGYRVLHHKSWKNPNGPLSCSMNDNDVSGLGVLAPAWQMRKFTDMIITSCYRGFALACLDGYERQPQFWGPFVRWLVYPAKEGVDGSIRLEVMREGLQDCEVRIFLESRETLPKDVQDLLDRRTERAWYLPAMPRDGGQGAEWYTGWQERSWDLYAAASRVAGGKAPSKEEKKRFFEEYGGAEMGQRKTP